MGGQIPLFGLGVSSRSPYVTAKYLQNMYVERRPDGEKSMLVAYGTPGLDLFVSFGATPARGGIEFEPTSVAFVVHRATLWEVNNAGTMTNRGALLTSSGRVSMSHNGVQIMIVDGTYGYIYNTNTTVFAQIVDADYPANTTTVTYLSRRFVVSILNSSRFYWSDIDNGLSWDALNFANAETNPDPIVAVYASNGQLILEGTATCEFQGNSGVGDPAFISLQGTANEWGLAARNSIAKFDNTFACVMKNRMGEVMIAKMSGYIPEKISTVDIDWIINRYTAVSDATGYSYMVGGHPMYVVSFPSAGYTWLFDGSTGFWSPLKSYGLTRHVGEFAFNLVGKTMIADYTSGSIYRLNPVTYTENGTMIQRQIVGETIQPQDGSALSIDKLRLDIQVGVGLASGQGSNPQIGLEVSRDGGNTWGAQMWRTLGAAGQYATCVEWTQLGTIGVPWAPSFTPRITVSDPVPVTIVSGCLNPG